MLNNNRASEYIKSLPEEPGIYIFKDNQGVVMYIGKAQSIKNRVKDHFQDKISRFNHLISSIDFITTRNEKEALILEDNLIKKYRPKYNIRFKDDKTYPLIMFTAEKYPRLQLIRNRRFAGTYFGPYTSSKAVKEILNFVSKTFGIAMCNKAFKVRNRPCLKYHFKYCLAPCCEKTDPIDYNQNVKDACEFLSGKVNSIINVYESQMITEANKLNFEKAAKYRDRISNLKHLVENQRVFMPNDRGSKDFIGLLILDDLVVLEKFRINDGRLVGENHYFFENTIYVMPEKIIEYFLEREYQNDINIPEIVVVAIFQHNREYKFNKKLINVNWNFMIKKAEDADEKSIIELAIQNCQQRIKIKEQEEATIKNKYETVVAELQKDLKLANLPMIVEGYDVSHLQGENVYGAMVVYNQGLPDRKNYRLFKINSESKDDYGYLEEVFNRRIKNYQDNKAGFINLPNLILVDGGSGQLGMMQRVLRKYKLNIPVVALAKEEEMLYMDRFTEPLKLAKNSKTLQFLQRVRDEAHRFSQKHHRQSREKLKSILLSIKGVGEIRTGIILNQLKNDKNIYNLNYDEILKLKGIPQPILRRIYDYLHK